MTTALTDPIVEAHVRWMRLRGLSERTISTRLTALRLLARHAGAPPLALTAVQLDTWQRSLVVTAGSRRCYVVQVTGFYRWAAGAGADPGASLRQDDPSTVLIRPKVRRGVPRPISEADLAAAIAGAPQPVRCWLELAAYEGLRACELAWLDVADIQEDQALMIVRGKGDKERAVPLGQTGLDALADYGLPRAGRAFRQRNGREISPVYVSNRVGRYLRKVGVRSSLHQCRHRFATQTLQVVPDLRVVQELLGHANPATTAIYTLVSSTRAAQAVAGLDRLRTVS